MKKQINWISIAIAILFSIVGISAITAAGFEANSEIDALSQRTVEIMNTRTTRVAGAAVEQASLIIAREHGNSVSLQFELGSGMTAYDALALAADSYDMALQTKQYDFGILIEGIGDRVNGQDDKNWLFYMNGEMAMNSADNQEVASGDKIEFRFESNPF